MNEYASNEVARLEHLVAEWEQCAGVEAKLRREFLADSEKYKAALERIIDIDTVVNDGGKVHDHGPCAEIAIQALSRC
jgi:hypothetical protein